MEVKTRNSEEDKRTVLALSSMEINCRDIEYELQRGERLTSVAEANAEFQRIRDNGLVDSKEKVRLRNGFLEAGKVKRKYKPSIRKKLVSSWSSSSASSSSNSSQTRNMEEEEDYLIALTYASEHDDVEEVKELAQFRGPHILGLKLPMFDTGTTLHVCIHYGSIKILRMLFSEYLEHLRLDILDDDGDTPIHNLPNRKLSYEMCREIARLILRNKLGFQMLSVGNRYKTGSPLCKALIYEEEDACKALLDAAGEFQYGDEDSGEEHWLEVTADDGNTALHLAAEKGYIDVVKGILDYPKIKVLKLPSKSNNHKNTPLHIAASRRHPQICSKLLEHDASPKVTNAKGETALDIVLRQGNVDLDVAGIIFHDYEITDASVNKSLGSGLTPLHVAVATSNSVDRIHEFLKTGAFVDARSDDGQTPLHIASARISTSMDACRVLLESSLVKKVNFSTDRMDRETWLNMRDFSGKTALHYAVTFSKRHLDKLDFECGVFWVSNVLCRQESARVDIKDSTGQTPLHIAAREGHERWVECLLEIEFPNGHRRLSKYNNREQWIAMCDFSGETALHEAVKKGRKPVVELLLKKTTNVNGLLRVRDIENRTALHWAVQQKDEAIIQTMLDVADPSTKRFLLWNAIGTAPKTPKILKQRIEDVKEQRMQNLLEDAVKTEDLDTARELINGGADVTSLQDESRLWLTRNFCRKASDQPTLEDSLGRRRLVEGIAALLLNPYTGTPVTIGVFGEWGTGKSSFMLQVEETLLYMTVKETFKNTRTHSKDMQALLGDDFKFSSSGRALRSKVIKEVKKRIDNGERKGDLIDKSSTEVEDDVIDQFPTKLLSEHRGLFKDLALTDRTKLVKFSGEQGKGKVLAMSDQMLKEAQVTGHAPAVLTVRYNAWQYENKTQASAGLAIEISKELESFMTPSQWLRMFWQYSWKSNPKDIFAYLFLPLFLILAAACTTILLWTVTPIKTKYKVLALPVGFLGVIWALFRSFLQVLQPVTQTILKYITSPDHESMLGYHQKVISDIIFLRDQLCVEANLWWTFLGFLGHVFISKSYYMKDTNVKKQYPRVNNLRIVVFIDDLDRCDEKTILEVDKWINPVNNHSLQLNLQPHFIGKRQILFLFSCAS